MRAVIESQDVKVLVAAVGGLMVIILGFLTSMMRTMSMTLKPNGGAPDSKSLFDKISALQDTVDDRFHRQDVELADHDTRLISLEEWRKASHS